MPSVFTSVRVSAEDDAIVRVLGLRISPSCRPSCSVAYASTPNHFWITKLCWLISACSTSAFSRDVPRASPQTTIWSISSVPPLVVAMDNIAWGDAPMAAAAATEERGSKRGRIDTRRSGPADMSASHIELIERTSMLAITMSNEVRALSGTVFRKFTLPASLPVVASCKAALKEYREKVHGNPKHKFGSPSHWLWRALLRGVYDHAAARSDADVVRRLQEPVDKCTPLELLQHIHHLKQSDV